MASEVIETAVEAVQHAIDTEISVYDPAFERYRDRFGDEFVHEYLSEVATHLAVHIVRAFEEHDMKRYQRCARAFGTVYTFLFPVRPTTAHTAGTSYALALKQHDAIEDGVHAVTSREPSSATSIGSEPERPQTAREILSHPYWHNVRYCFDLVGDALDLPPVYAEQQTAFFRYHTAANEAAACREAPAEDLMAIALDHAEQAQWAKFQEFFDDDHTLKMVVERYLEAVKAHDAHMEAEQDANVSRMIVIYEHALAAVVGVDPLV